MTRAAETQATDTMLADLESAVPGFDWLYDIGDDRETVVRKTYAGAVILAHAKAAQLALAAVGPEWAAPMKLVVTAGGIDLRPI